jgi:hypothetical protein
MNVKIIISLCILVIGFSGCWPLKQWFLKPDEFRLNQNSFDDEEIGGFIICPLDSVEQFAKNGLLLYSGSFVDMYINEIYNEKHITQFQADFTAELNSGTGFSFFFRTIADHFEQHPNITFEYTTGGCKVFDSGNLITSVDSIKAELNKPARILIENYGKLFNIVVDCDTVFYGRTGLYTTQHMILKPVTGSNIRLSGIRFIDLNKDVRTEGGWKIDGFLSGE